MASKDLGIRFTEEKYATKQEAGKELGISIVDNLWDSVLKYRDAFKRYLTIRSVDNNKLTYCLCPAITDNVNQLDFRLIHAYKEYNNIKEEDLEYFKRKSYVECLKSLAKVRDLDVTDEYLLSIVDGGLKEPSPSYKILVDYFNALKYVERAYVNPINDSFLANVYSRLIDQEELISFYRTNDIKDHQNRVIIDRIYTAVPAKSIDSMMENLFDFIENYPLSVASKAIITYYYFYYIKPFPEYNDELALLLTKAVMGHNGINEVGALLNLERLLGERLEENTKKSIEVQKTNDVTYFVTFGLTFFNDIVNKFIDSMSALSATAIRSEYYAEDVDIYADENEEKKVNEEEESVPVEENTQAEAPKSNDDIEELAISRLPRQLDEKEASRLEQDLLESDPNLKKGEAYFYARHCTMNRHYTIAQYKKALGCAYETARTAMENLVRFGYYRKEKIKNKFVYTPIRRK